MFIMIERPPTSATERKMKIATPPRTHTATTHGHGQAVGRDITRPWLPVSCSLFGLSSVRASAN
jgi:hypothetical protein